MPIHPGLGSPSRLRFAPLLAVLLLLLAGCTGSPPEPLGRTSAAVCASVSFIPSPSNAAPGTPVTWTATAGCDSGDTPQYEFWMQPPGGSWAIVQPYGAAATYAWSTTGLATGVYDFEVWSRAAGSTADWESAQDKTYNLSASTPCTGGALSFNPVSAASVGTTVTLTGAASCAGTPEYQFWMQPPGGAWTIVQPYGATSTHAWDTTGLAAGVYDFEVWVRNEGSGANEETYHDQTYTLVGPCTGGALSFNPVSPSVPGTAVTLTGTASCGGTPEYEFWMQPPGGTWTIVQPYGASRTYAWSTAGLATGSYDFEVWVRNEGSGAYQETYQDQTYVLSSGSSGPPCTGGALSFSPSSPSSPGTAVTLSGTASCSGTAEYEFWMQPPGGAWSIVRPYGASGTYAWDSTGLADGVYDFEVWVRNVGSGASFETYQDQTYTLAGSGTGSASSSSSASSSAGGTGGASSSSSASTSAGGTGGASSSSSASTSGASSSAASSAAASSSSGAVCLAPCSGITATFSPSFSRVTGMPVTVVASATCGGTPEYTFSYRQRGVGPSTLGQPFGPSATFIWDTTGLALGFYDVDIGVRNQGASFATYQQVGHGFGDDLSGGPNACSNVTLSTSPPATSSAGTSVVLTAGATCPGPAEYSFLVQSPGSYFESVLQDFGPNSTFTWDTTLLTAGTYTFTVNAKVVDVDNGGDTASQSYVVTSGAVTGSPCTDGALSIEEGGSASPGDAVHLLASARCGGTPEYEFLVQPPGGSWTVAQPYGPSNAYVWDTTGLATGGYTLEVRVRNQGSTATEETSQDQAFSLQTFCTGAVLAVTPPSPQTPGAAVTFTGTASCGGTPEYAFYVQAPSANAVLVQPYGPNNTYVWDTSCFPAALYTVTVFVRLQGEYEDYDTVAESYYSLAGSACTSAALSANPPSPSNEGPVVTLTAGAACGGTPEYAFLIQPGGDPPLSDIGNYGPSNTYAWNTSGSAAGTYGVQVRVRDQGSTVAYDTYQNLTYTISDSACTNAILAFSPASPSPPGTTVTMTGTATCGGTPEYEFSVWSSLTDETTILRPYGPSSTYAWNTTGLAEGDYYPNVAVRNQGASIDETIAQILYTLHTPACGNGVIDPGEACDGEAFGGATCASALGDPRQAGALQCTATCTLDTMGCAPMPACATAGATYSVPVTGQSCLADGNDPCPPPFCTPIATTDQITLDYASNQWTVSIASSPTVTFGVSPNGPTSFTTQGFPNMWCLYTGQNLAERTGNVQVTVDCVSGAVQLDAWCETRIRTSLGQNLYGCEDITNNVSGSVP